LILIKKNPFSGVSPGGLTPLFFAQKDHPHQDKSNLSCHSL
jgi:hypothetical protein